MASRGIRRLDLTSAIWRLTLAIGLGLTTCACTAPAVGAILEGRGSAPTPIPRSSLAATPDATLSNHVWLPLTQKASAVQTSSSHPRLFFSSADVPALQARAQSSHSDIWLGVKAFTASQLNSAPPAQPFTAPDLNTEQDDFRNGGNELIAFALTCRIQADTASCALAKRYLLAYATWTRWGEGGQRGLGLAHMVLGNTIAYDWIFDRLTAVEQTTVRTTLATHAQELYEAATGAYSDTWLNWWRKSYAQNHDFVIYSALGTAALALWDEDSRSPTWFALARDRMTSVQTLLNGIQDGSWHEGIPYQSYALTMALPFWVNARRLQGVDLLPHAYLAQYARWRIYNRVVGASVADTTAASATDTSAKSNEQYILPSGDFDWSWGDSYAPYALLHFVAAEQHDGYAQWLAGQLVSAGRKTSVYDAPWQALEFFYFDPSVATHAPDASPGALSSSATFTDAQAVVWRTGWGASDLAFAFKSGAYGGRFAFDSFVNQLQPWGDCHVAGCQLNMGHDHDDTNGFYLFRAGRWLAPEVVANNGYESSLHNVMLVDGQGQDRLSQDAPSSASELAGTDGKLLSASDMPDFDFLAADATQRYRSITGLSQVQRRVVFVRAQPAYFLILDNLSATAAHTYTWVCHFNAPVTVSGNWLRSDASVTQTLGVELIAPQPMTYTLGNDGLPFVHTQPATPAPDARLIHLLAPLDSQNWNGRPDGQLVSDDGISATIHVTQTDGRADDVVMGYGSSPSADLAVVSRDASATPIRLMLSNGTTLVDPSTGQTLIDASARLPAIEARMSGTLTEVFVQTQVPATTTIKLLAPNSQTVLVNGVTAAFTRQGDLIVITVAKTT